MRHTGSLRRKGAGKSMSQTDQEFFFEAYNHNFKCRQEAVENNDPQEVAKRELIMEYCADKLLSDVQIIEVNTAQGGL